MLTRQPNLPLLMRHLNGVYTQALNRRHGKAGHVFRGRFKALLVDREAYLLALCRYVELNPVAARLVSAPAAWAWSSHAAHIGTAPTPAWLDSDGLHGYLLGHAMRDVADRTRAAATYAAPVLADGERPGLGGAGASGPLPSRSGSPARPHVSRGCTWPTRQAA